MPVDHDQELRRGSWLLGAWLFFAFATYSAYGELHYAVWGKTVAADVARPKKASPELGQRDTSLTTIPIEYSFTDRDGRIRHERDLLPGDWPTSGKTIDVQYVPGEKNWSRVAGHRNLGKICLFLGSLVVLVGANLILPHEAKNTDQHPPRRSR